LLFVLPLVVVYELGTRLSAVDPGPQTYSHIIAFTYLQRFFRMFGATGAYLPAMAVIGVLLTWHIARRDSWHWRVSTLLLMGLESIALGAPILLMDYAVQQYLPMFATGGRWAAWQDELIKDIGAGLYEELVFRLVGFTLLSLLLVDLLKVPRRWAAVVSVVGCALAFSLYHYAGHEAFAWRTFVFRTLAGVYFGVIFLVRGFGITAGSHAAYDVILTVCRNMR
jgi:hypothetical protein